MVGTGWIAGYFIGYLSTDDCTVTTTERVNKAGAKSTIKTSECT